jgi:hypothetical protein
LSVWQGGSGTSRGTGLGGRKGGELLGGGGVGGRRSVCVYFCRGRVQ